LNVIHLVTTGILADSYADLPSSELDEMHRAVRFLPYPPGAMPGPASVNFYAIVSTLGNWQGSAFFTADPAACIDVVLFVPFLPCCGHEPDSGTNIDARSGGG
jgi:hypothetical protein